MTVLQEKQIYIYFKLAGLTKYHQLDYKDKSDSDFNFHKFSYNTLNKILRRRNVYWYHEKCIQSTFSMPKAKTQIGTDGGTKDKRKAVREHWQKTFPTLSGLGC